MRNTKKEVQKNMEHKEKYKGDPSHDLHIDISDMEMAKLHGDGMIEMMHEEEGKEYSIKITYNHEEKEEKEEPYKAPYKSICGELFGYDGAWGKLTTTKSVGFETTSFIRGVTFDRTILVVDEMQNMNFHELDSIITRIGNDCKIIFCGDHNQTDFKRKDEKDGIIKFISLIEQMRFFRVINFGWVDIVRSDFVRDYIMTKEMMGF